MHELMALTAMMSGWLMNYLAHSAVTLLLLGAMAWMGDRMLRRVGPQAQHQMWVAALLAGVGLPLLPAGWLTHFGGAAAGGGAATATVTYRMVASAAGRWSAWPMLMQVLAGAYLLAVLLCLSRLLGRWRQTRAMARRSAVQPLDARALGLLERAARRLGVAAPEVRCSAETCGPVVLGLRRTVLLRTVLLVPERFFDAEDEDIAAALTHECAHLARRDFAKNLVYEVVAAAVAYHPMCRLMRRRIAETRELVCDEMAAGAAEGRPEYAASLLRLATSMVTPAGRAIYARETHAIGVFDANILEERIMRLTMDAPKASRMQKAAMAAVATCALLVGAGTATALSFDVTPQEGAAQSRTQEKIYKVGGEVSAPKLNHSVDATYPKNERRKGKTGTTIVVCSLVVDSDGLPRDIKIKKSAGSDFDASAMDAVRQYKFDPAMRQGKPVAVAVTIEVNFRLY